MAPFPARIIVYRPKVGIIVFFSVLRIIHIRMHYTRCVPFRFPRVFCVQTYRYNIFIRPQLFGDQSSDKRRTLLCIPIILVFSL